MKTRRRGESSPLRPRPTEQDQLDFEIRFFEGLVADCPDFLEALIPLAEAYTKRGMTMKGFLTDQKICALSPKDPLAHYNLACSCALLGKSSDALIALEKAFALGYRDIEHVQKDKDLESLRSDPRLHQLMSRYSLRKEGTQETFPEQSSSN